MPASTQTRRITIVADTSGITGLKDMADKLGGINKNTKELASGMQSLGAATTAFLSALYVRQLASFSDEIQVLNNRLVALTGSQDEATRTLNALTQVSRDTNTSLEATGETYLTIANATKAAHLSTETLLEVTKTLTDTFRLSGSSAEEAASATKSLALGFQLGGIQGRELRTILRQNTVLAGLLRKEFGAQLKSDSQLGFLSVGKLLEILHKNASQVNTSAQALTATFGQTMTKGLDAVKLKVYDLTTALGGPQGFSTAMGFAIKHMDDFIAVAGVLSLTAIPSIISSLRKLGASLIALNPYALVVGIEALVLYFASGAKNASDFFLLIKLGFADAEAGIDRAIAKFYELDAALPRTQESRDYLLHQAAANRQAATDAEVHARALNVLAQVEEEVARRSAKAGAGVKQFGKDVKSANDNLKFDETSQKQLADLNRQFESGRITLTAYNEALLKLDVKKTTREFHDGKQDVLKYHDELRKVREFGINKDFKDGALSIDEFNTAIRGIGLEKLNEQLQAGTISLADYNSKLAAVSDQFSTGGAFRTGLQDYLNSVGTTTQQVAGAIKSAFGEVETEFLAFIKTGTFNFDKFAQSVLDDLTKIIIRAQIVQPLAQSILSGFQLTTPAATTSIPQAGPGNYIVQPSAHGNVFDMGLKRFANGGVVSSPTMFGYGKGKTGLMGEAGPEAIIPLKRGSGGDLGVAATVTPVHVNIINQSGATIDQQETTGPNGEKTIEVMIRSKVAQGIANGSFDKAFKQSFALNRKGQ